MSTPEFPEFQGFVIYREQHGPETTLIVTPATGLGISVYITEEAVGAEAYAALSTVMPRDHVCVRGTANPNVDPTLAALAPLHLTASHVRLIPPCDDGFILVCAGDVEEMGGHFASFRDAMFYAYEWVYEQLRHHYRKDGPPTDLTELDIRCYRLGSSGQIELPLQDWVDNYFAVIHAEEVLDTAQADLKREEQSLIATARSFIMDGESPFELSRAVAQHQGACTALEHAEAAYEKHCEAPYTPITDGETANPQETAHAEAQAGQDRPLHD